MRAVAVICAASLLTAAPALAADNDAEGLYLGVGLGDFSTGIDDISDADETNQPLRGALRTATRADGAPLFTAASGLALMVFFVLACQCMSTLAVVRRESGSWRWPLFMFGYQTVLAYAAALVVYQGARALGLGA